MQAASIRLLRGACPAQSLCDSCLYAGADQPPARLHHDVARFFTLLMHPRRPSPALDLPLMPDETVCTACGLSYREFSRLGLAGCGGCYDAFAPAIRHALIVLHDRV